MDEESDNSKQKNIINLSRNTPIALVVGAAGFLGSHLTDRLLDKGIQVIGVDNLATGRKENLHKATRDKHFHFIIEDAENLDFETPRLDYVFVVSSEGWNLDNLLQIVKGKGAKCLFVSTIELYDEENIKDFEWFKETESKIAKFATDHQINARVLRLGPVFGPRMHFRTKDPIIKLIQAAANDQLQKVSSLEFSTRALYALDACDLMIKAMLSGATALKIFDGVLPAPIKVSEIKQILLDPVWYESKRFEPSELPPWQTPNLIKTMKILNWHPKGEIVTQLRNTLSYFRDFEIRVPKVDQEEKEVIKQKQEWKKENKKELEEFKEAVEDKQLTKKEIKFGFNWSRVVSVAVVILVLYAFVVPFVEVGFGIVTFRFQLANALNNLQEGKFEKSASSLQAAEKGVLGAKSVFNSLEPIRKTGQFKSFFKLGDDLYDLASLSLSSSQATVLGIEALYDGVMAVTGERNETPNDYFLLAQSKLATALEDFLKAQLILADSEFKQSIPPILKSRVDSLNQRFSLYSKLIEQGRAASILLPEIVALEGSKKYLVLLQNNNELRPTGGFIGSFGLISFEGGRLKKVEVQDIYAIDGQLNIQVEPPPELKSDLGQNSWYLRDSNWEPDFPTAARQAEWFFTKETGERVSGVVALDVSAMEKLLEALGPLDLSDYGEKISADNLFERAITHAETSFFAGSQAKKNFLTALANSLFNKIFFSKDPNWPGIVKALGDSLNSKHMSVYLDDPKLFSYLVAQNWAGVLAREIPIEGVVDDFIAPVEANLGANKSNYYLDRSYTLETTVGKEGEVSHRLRISYINKSPSVSWPAGKYKNRFRIYFPYGTRLTKVMWGEADISRDVTAFADYGRTAFSMLLEVEPKQQKILVLDYEMPRKLQFEQDKAIYKLNVVKQAGTLNDPFIWRLTYPLNYTIVSDDQISSGKEESAPQEKEIQTDLSSDRSFEIIFKKN